MTEDAPSRPSKRVSDIEDGSKRPRFENGGTTGRVPGGQKDERQRDRLRRRGSRIRDRRRKQIREGKKYPTGVKESTPAEMRERTKNSQPLDSNKWIADGTKRRKAKWNKPMPQYPGRRR